MYCETIYIGDPYIWQTKRESLLATFYFSDYKVFVQCKYTIYNIADFNFVPVGIKKYQNSETTSLTKLRVLQYLLKNSLFWVANE